MKYLTLATTQQDPLHLYTRPGRVGLDHLPEAIAAQIGAVPREHLLAWSAADAGSAGFSQNGQSLILPFPLVSAGIGSMQPAKGGGFVTLFVRTVDAGVIDVLGSHRFHQATLETLLAHQSTLAALLGCSVTAEDWGYDC